jgi:AcrR family transcriptional regulator
MKEIARVAAPPPADALCNRIIGAAFETIMKKGFQATSMLDVATRARVSKRDLYANFPSKQAVLAACITSRAARMRLSPDLPAPTSRATLAAALTAFGATVLREVCLPPVMAMYRLAIAEAERSPEVAEAMNASRLQSRAALGEMLVRAQVCGLLGEVEPQHMTEQFFALLWGDLLLNRLLGVAGVPKPAEIDRRARKATEEFLGLYAKATSNGRRVAT